MADNEKNKQTSREQFEQQRRRLERERLERAERMKEEMRRHNSSYLEGNIQTASQNEALTNQRDLSKEALEKEYPLLKEKEAVQGQEQSQQASEYKDKHYFHLEGNSVFTQALNDIGTQVTDRLNQSAREKQEQKQLEKQQQEQQQKQQQQMQR